MSGAHSRRKGAAFERELVHRFREVMQPSLHAAPPLPGWQARIPLRDGLRELAAPTQAPAP